MTETVILKSSHFDRWLRSLKDTEARARINVRLGRLASGNPGDVKPVGQGVHERRVHVGPGYRIYFMQEGRQLLILLSGGDKSHQQRDIQRAHDLATEWRSRGNI